MGATFRKMTGRMNKAERRAWRKVLAEKEWLEDIERYRIELEEEKRIEQERLGIYLYYKFLCLDRLLIHLRFHQLWKR